MAGRRRAPQRELLHLEHRLLARRVAELEPVVVEAIAHRFADLAERSSAACVPPLERADDAATADQSAIANGSTGEPSAPTGRPIAAPMRM